MNSTTSCRLRGLGVSPPWLAVGCYVAVLALTGCGSGSSAGTKIQGKISNQNKSASNGVIAFLKRGEKPIGAAIQPDGSYSAEAPPGEYQVRIDAPPPLPEGWKEGQPLPQLGPRSVPEKYANFSTSGLTATINSDSPQQLDFKLP